MNVEEQSSCQCNGEDFADQLLTAVAKFLNCLALTDAAVLLGPLSLLCVSVCVLTSLLLPLLVCSAGAVSCTGAGTSTPR